MRAAQLGPLLMEDLPSQWSYGTMPRKYENRGVDEVMMKPVAKRRLRSYPQKAIDRPMNGLRLLNGIATGPSWTSMHPINERGTTRVPSRDRTNTHPYRQIRLQACIERGCLQTICKC